MQNAWQTILATVLSVLVTLIATLIFNKIIAVPAAIKKQREAHNQEIAKLKTDYNTLKLDHDTLKTQVSNIQKEVDKLPTYRTQSLKIQADLQTADNALLRTCEAIQSSVNVLQTSANMLQTSIDTLKAGQEQTRTSLNKLEDSERDSLRMKIICDYKLFADPKKNPELAWSEMEYHAFNALVSDYEALGGNDYVHDTVSPAMNALEIVSMRDVKRLEEVMNARHAK